MWYNVRLAEQRQPYAMTWTEFIDHHKTGHIPDSAYKGYKTSEGLEYITYDNFPIPYAEIDLRGKHYEIRRDDRPRRYVKWEKKKFKFGDQEWEDDDIAYDPVTGDALYLTDEEALAQGLPIRSFDLAAFYDGKPVGFASDEWGATGIWVVDEHQGNGLGTYLIRELRRNNPHLKRIGQMTNAGEKMTRAYHRSLIKDALEEGKVVSPEVLADYPELKGDKDVV
jgi:GNAT superfamily N-acetyltransferase